MEGEIILRVIHSYHKGEIRLNAGGVAPLRFPLYAISY